MEPPDKDDRRTSHIDASHKEPTELPDTGPTQTQPHSLGPAPVELVVAEPHEGLWEIYDFYESLPPTRTISRS